MTIVLDSNILMAFALNDEPLHTQAAQKLAQWTAAGVTFAAPRLFRSEIGAVMRKAVFQSRISHDQGRTLLTQLLAFPVEFHDEDWLLQRAYEMAYQFNRPRAYDSQYMALAEHLDCELWTADQVLVNAVQKQFARIRWLGTPTK